MKKQLLALLLCVLFVSLTACGDKKSAESTAEGAAEATTIVQESEPDDKSSEEASEEASEEESKPTKFQQLSAQLEGDICAIGVFTFAEVVIPDDGASAAVTVKLAPDKAVSTSHIGEIRTLLMQALDSLTKETISVTVTS